MYVYVYFISIYMFYCKQNILYKKNPNKKKPKPPNN